MIDFNPTRIRQGLAAQTVLATIDDALVANAESQKRRTYLGASAIGSLCERRVQYEYMGCDYDTDYKPSPRTQRIFARGHLGEEMVAKWIRMAGYELKTEKPNGHQFGFRVADGKFSGHCDGIITGGPDIETPCIWEHKCLGAKSWKQIENKGVAHSKPEYADQIALYQAYLELPAPALFTALNMDTMELYAEFIAFDKKRAQDASDRAVAIIQDTQAGALRPRISDDEDFWLCKNKSGKCQFWGRCHGDKF